MGLINGLRPTPNSDIQVPILQFADDTMILCNDSEDEVMAIKGLLYWFGRFSGLKVNYGKSALMGINVQPENLINLAGIIGCEIGSFPCRHLGTPLGAGYRNVKVWDPIVERIDKRLALWQRKLLSKAGRLQLCISTVNSIPVFLMSCIICPATVIEKIERRIRKFLWGFKAEKRGVHLVSWNVITTSKKRGGLGLKNLKEFNASLLTKWHWRFGNERDALWRMIIADKFGLSLNGFYSLDKWRSVCWSFWKGILKFQKDFVIKIGFTVGKGDRVLFWHDSWCGDQPLGSQFNDLFLTSEKKNETVNKFCETDSGTVIWTIGGGPYEIQVQNQYNLLTQILPATLILDEEDEWFVKGTKKGFQVNQWNDWLCISRSQRMGILEHNWNFKRLWKAKTPPRAKFLIWLVLRNRVLTRSRLFRFGISTNAECGLCCRERKDCNHLFMKCTFAESLWRRILDGFGLNRIHTTTIWRAWEEWEPPDLSDDGKVIWEGIFHMACWVIWRARNDKVFRGVEITQERLFTEFLTIAWSWMGTYCLFDVRLADFIFRWNSIV